MFGAILGDIIGSPYEFDCNNIKTKDFPLFSQKSHFTDDTVMTLAVAKAFMDTENVSDDKAVKANLVASMRELGAAYPDAGYGGRFAHWLTAENSKPYHSYGNGSAMRVSSVAWMFDTIEEVRRAARLSAEVTHNHREGIKGAEATAIAIFLARKGYVKGYIQKYIETEFGYDLHRTCDEIRPNYHHVESCQETVPEAIIAFLEGESFEDVIRTAVSLGGDCDTLTAIAGSIAEGYYGIDEDWKKAALWHLPEDLAQILRRFDVTYGVFQEPPLNPVHEAMLFAEKAHRGQKRKGTAVDYITHPMEVYQILTSMQAGQELLIAGLLHDTVEDTDVDIDDIQFAFGDRVSTLAANHTENKRLSWRERKQRTIDTVKVADRDTRLLIMADKVSNLRSMLSDYSRVGEQLWERFNASKEEQSWYNSELQDALNDLQFDDAARLVYWEMVGLYKDLFVTFYADFEEKKIYQAACHGETVVSCREDGAWLHCEGEIPPMAVQLPRLKAERLEDLWREECHNTALDGNERIEASMAAFGAEESNDTLVEVLQTIFDRRQEGGQMIFPVEFVHVGNEGIKMCRIRTVTARGDKTAVAAFTSYTEVRRAPESDMEEFAIGDTLESIMKDEEIEGLSINPWGDGIYLPKTLLKLILDHKKELENEESREEQL